MAITQRYDDDLPLPPIGRRDRLRPEDADRQEAPPSALGRIGATEPRSTVLAPISDYRKPVAGSDTSGAGGSFRMTSPPPTNGAGRPLPPERSGSALGTIRGDQPRSDLLGSAPTDAAPTPFIGPQRLRTPGLNAPAKNAEPEPVAAPQLQLTAGTPQLPGALGAIPRYSGGRRAMREDLSSRATDARDRASAAYVANPSDATRADYDRAKLAQEQVSGSGISRIHNPVLRTLGRIGDIAGTAMFPAVTAEIPGTELHHRIQMGRTERDLGQAVEQEEREAQIGSLQSIPEYRRAQARRQAYITPRQGGVFNVDTNTWAAPPNQKESPTDQREAFANGNPDMFADDNERKNFVLYGNRPPKADANPNEWQLRLDAAGGDEDAQAALDQRFTEERDLAGIRANAAADRRAGTQEDQGNAEAIASKILNNAGGDPDKALQLFDQHAPNITDPDEKRLGPAIRKAIRGRKQINKPPSAIDQIISGDVAGGLNQMQPQQP